LLFSIGLAFFRQLSGFRKAMAKNRKRPRTPENKATWFMIRVAEGMSAWASFAQATFLSPVYSEALTYRPIFEIARPRDWKPWPQKKLAKQGSKLGRNRTVDFVFQSKDKRIGVFLEVKFMRKRAKHCAQVSKDVCKLALLNKIDIAEKNPPTDVFRFILLIGTKNDIKSRIGSYAKKLKDGDLSKLSYTEDHRLLEQVRLAFENSDTRQANGFDAWAFAGLGNDKWKYWSVLLKEKSWWRKLAKLKGKLPDDVGKIDDDAPGKVEDDAEGEIDA
jgi:hypothetical protein